jgi:membrane protein YqaA with SNARE-associated domain
MDEKTKGAIQIILAIVIGIIVFIFAKDVALLGNYGYLGVFAISLLSSATIFFPAPGWAVVISMGSVLNPYLVGIVAGIGSGLGEITGYLLGSGVMNVANKDLEKQKDLIKKYGLPIIFLLAFLPNPLFDIAGLAAGAMKIKPWKFLAVCILGRTLRYVILAHVGMFIGDYVV